MAKIWERVFENAGESFEGGLFYRCPGEPECDLFTAAGGIFEERSKVCLDCSQCKGNAPLQFSERQVEAACSESEVAELVDEIENIIERQNAGLITDWGCYEFEYQKLAVEWRKAENFLKEVRERNFQNFMKSFFAES